MHFDILIRKSFHLDVELESNCALVTEACGRAHLVNVDFKAQKTEIGRVIQNYCFREADRQGGRFNHAFGSIFAMGGKLVVFASVSGKVFVWDRMNGVAEYEMNHGGGERHIFGNSMERLILTLLVTAARPSCPSRCRTSPISQSISSCF